MLTEAPHLNDYEMVTDKMAINRENRCTSGASLRLTSLKLSQRIPLDDSASSGGSTVSSSADSGDDHAPLLRLIESFGARLKEREREVESEIIVEEKHTQKGEMVAPVGRSLLQKGHVTSHISTLWGYMPNIKEELDAKAKLDCYSETRERFDALGAGAFLACSFAACLSFLRFLQSRFGF